MVLPLPVTTSSSQGTVQAVNSPRSFVFFSLRNTGTVSDLGIFWSLSRVVSLSFALALPFRSLSLTRSLALLRLRSNFILLSCCSPPHHFAILLPSSSVHSTRTRLSSFPIAANLILSFSCLSLVTATDTPTVQLFVSLTCFNFDCTPFPHPPSPSSDRFYQPPRQTSNRGHVDCVVPSASSSVRLNMPISR